MPKTRTTEAENEKKGEKVDVLCIKCNVETEHLVVQSFDTSGSEPYEDYDANGCSQSSESIYWSTSNQIIRCGGCKTVSFRQVSWFSEEEGTVEKLFPIRSKGKLTRKEFHNAPTALRRIYSETIESFNNECPTLCAGGLRAIVEGICADKKVKKGPVVIVVKGKKEIRQRRDLNGKINGLREQGILTKHMAAVLHAHRYLGNDAVHDLDMPSAEELRLAIGILEHVLEELYRIKDSADEIKWRRKQRQKGTMPTLRQRLKGKLPNTR